MNFKKFAIVASVFIGVVFTLMIVLGCIHVDNSFEIDEPSKIIYYVKSSVGVERTKSESPKVYENITEKFNKSIKLTVFDYMAKGLSLNAKPGQAGSTDYSSYTATLKENGVCVEYIFSDKQSIVVEVDGNTKVVEFYSFIMEVKDSSRAKEVALYFSTSSGEYKDYANESTSKYPILIVAKQNKLYNYIMSLVEDDE